MQHPKVKINTVTLSNVTSIFMVEEEAEETTSEKQVASETVRILGDRRCTDEDPWPTNTFLSAGFDTMSGRVVYQVALLQGHYLSSAQREVTDFVCPADHPPKESCRMMESFPLYLTKRYAMRVVRPVACIIRIQ
jgi:hypothetical protein